MTLSTTEVGRRGERLAEDYLLSLGARLLERNVHFDFAEIDLLFEHEGEFVAVEVKTRSLEDLEQPEEAVYWSQLRRIATAMTSYAQDNDLLDRPHRIDVVLIVYQSDGEVLRFEHIKSAFPG